MNNVTYDERKAIYGTALERWGAEAQTMMAIEEMSELTKEICKLGRDKGDMDSLADEIADVTIMLEQLRLIYNLNDQVCEHMDSKIRRLADRLGLGVPDGVAVKAEEPKRPMSRVERVFGKKETWNQTQATPPEDLPTARGFLIVECKGCGRKRAFCSKTPIISSPCRACGTETPLDMNTMRPVHARCKCGRTFKYMTNATTETISINCLSCGAPIDLQLNGKGNAYVTPAARAGGGGTNDSHFKTVPFYLTPGR